MASARTVTPLPSGHLGSIPSGTTNSARAGGARLNANHPLAAKEYSLLGDYFRQTLVLLDAWQGKAVNPRREFSGM